MMGNDSSAKDNSSGDQVAIKKVCDSYPELISELTYFLFTGVSYFRKDYSGKTGTPRSQVTETL